MTQISREANKDRYKTGMVPTQGDYVNLIDSFAVLTNDQNSGSLTLSGSLIVTGSISLEGDLSSSQDLIVRDITSSNNINVVGTLTAEQITSTDDVQVTDDLQVGGSTNFGTSQITQPGQHKHAHIGIFTSSLNGAGTSPGGGIGGGFLIQSGSHKIMEIAGSPREGDIKIQMGDLTGVSTGTILTINDATQIIHSTQTISSSKFQVGPSNSLLSSGTISSSGTITASLNSIVSIHNLTASNNISASGEIIAHQYLIGGGGVSDAFAQAVVDQIDPGEIPTSSIAPTWTFFQATHISASAVSASGHIEGRLRRPLYTITGNGALTINHEGAYVRCGSHKITIPLNSDVAFPIGTEIDFIQTSSDGHLLITASSGESVTINSRFELYSASGQFSAISCKKVGTNEWDMIGDLTA